VQQTYGQDIKLMAVLRQVEDAQALLVNQQQTMTINEFLTCYQQYKALVERS
jgi:hypothetical protein